MTTTIANETMAAAWDGDEGEDWARDWRYYDRAVRGYHRRLLAAAPLEPGAHVLDIGCGTGESTRDAARAAPAGTATGVDLSTRMLERAREVAAAEGVANVEFVHGDAQVHPFAPGAFSVAISRFGAMFFAEPAVAFTNLAGALTPGGRLALVAWRSLEDNEWLQCIRSALAAGRPLPAPPQGAPGPFGLADPDLTRTWLREAGFVDVEIEGVDAPFEPGTDADDAFGFLSRTGAVRGLTQDLDDAARSAALEKLHAALRTFETADGVALGSGGWLVTAKRR